MANSFLFFDDATGLWSVDEATGVATQLTSQTQSTGGLSKGMAVVGGTVVYAAHSPGSTAIADRQVWATDGTTAGTVFIASIPDNSTGGTDTAGVYGIAALSNGRVAISYTDGVTSGLDISSGTRASTFRASTFAGTAVPFSNLNQVALLTGPPPFADNFWFVNGGYVWYYAVTGTSVYIGATLNAEVGLAVAGNKVFYAAAASGSSSYSQLWTESWGNVKTLVTTLPDSSNGAGGAAINALTTLSSNKVAFTYINGSTASQSIYLSDGTALGTVQVSGYTGTAFAGPDQTAELAGALLFMDGNGLWSVNETTGVASLVTGFSGYLPSDMRLAGGKVFFDLSTGTSSAAPQLWVTNGSAAGTMLVEQLPNNMPSGGGIFPAIAGMATLGDGRLAIDYFDGATENVYLSDGTAAGTTPVTGFSSTANNLLFYNNSQIAEVSVACFAQGTRLETASGRRAVEDLSIGDHLVTPAGLRPIRWLGHRSIACRRQPRPASVWPVRVVAGAFGPGQPSRDIRLSPDHAVFIGGNLIPVRYLINGTTIAQEQRDTITYWHVALTDHAVIFAEGLPTESFLDTGGRIDFDNNAVVALHPRFASSPSHIYEAYAAAPLIVAGPELTRAREALAAQALLLVQAAGSADMVSTRLAV